MVSKELRSNHRVRTWKAAPTAAPATAAGLGEPTLPCSEFTVEPDLSQLDNDDRAVLYRKVNMLRNVEDELRLSLRNISSLFACANHRMPVGQVINTLTQLRKKVDEAIATGTELIGARS